MINEQNNETKKAEKELLKGKLVHFLYSLCLENELSMKLFKKGKEDLKELVDKFYDDGSTNEDNNADL